LNAARGSSNAILAAVVKLGQEIYDKHGLCHVHSILISIVLVMVADEGMAVKLSETVRGDGIGSYGDMVLNGIMNIIDRPDFWPSLALVFHNMAPNVGSFTRATADRVMAFFAKLWKEQRLLCPVFLATFASILRAT
jgi:hypothetical protein